MISFLAALQEKGRLVDFLMDDVTSFEDAQVGAAARVVHEGCRAALDEVFTIAPVTESAEGTTISVPAKHRADEYRLTGKLSGQAPIQRHVVHRGWRTTKTKLPQIIVPDGEVPCIAPAEIEVRSAPPVPPPASPLKSSIGKAARPNEPSKIHPRHRPRNQ